MQEAPPKFASFRAKTVVPASAPSRIASPDCNKNVPEREQDKPGRRHTSHRYHISKRQRHEDHSIIETERKEQHLKQADDVPPIPSSETYGGPTDLFIVDRRGDVGNVKYGYNERYKIPDYREPSLRKLLGDDGRFSESRAHKGSPLVLLSREDRRRLKEEVATYVTSDNFQRWVQTDLDFIVLNPGNKRKRNPDRSALASKDDARDRVRDNGERDNGSATSDDTSEASESDDQAIKITIDDKAALKAEKVRLSTLVKEQPHNVTAWLEYVDFQERWTYQGQEVEGLTLPREEQQSLADVKLSIYKKALAVVPVSHPDREMLLLGMMRDSELVLEDEKLMAKWQSVVAENATYLKLGQKFLNYVQSNLTGFDFNASCERNAEFMDQLSKSKQSRSFRVYTILRLTVFMSEAGYHERAFALWQAVFELGVFTTDAQSTSWAGVLAAFETFWEAERPRIGELHAHGWQDPQTSMEPPIGHGRISKSAAHSNDKANPWLQHELKKSQQMKLPGRLADDSSDSDDMHHLVLFEDIKPFLFDMRCEGYPIDLVNSFLCFMHLPSLPDDDTKPSQEELSKANISSDDYWIDEFLRNELLTNDFDSFYCDKWRRHQIDHHQMTLHQLFSNGNSFGTTLPRMNSDEEDDRKEPPQTEFIRNLMQALLKRFPTWSALAEYYLALERRIDPGVTRKMAKILSKAQPSSLRLYNTYALVEAKSGKPEVADQILSTAIRMSSTLDVEEQQSLIYLWHTRMTEARPQVGLGFALQRCLMISRAGLMQDHPAQDIQDAEHYFNTGRQRALETSMFYLAAVYSTCLSLLYYFSSESISTAIEAYANQCIILASYGPSAAGAIEYLHQERVLLMKDHIAQSRPYKPKDIRVALRDSIATFPSNTIFLQLFAETESRFRIDDRVRQLARDVLNSTPAGYSSDTSATHEQSSNLIINAFNIQTELRRAETAGSTRHAVRAAFERAVADSQCRHNGTIWLMYLYYEVHLVEDASEDLSQKGEGVSRVKNVFHRGLRCLPWIKMWYLRGMEVLLRFGLEEEAKSLAALMVDKGLRVSEELSA